MQFNISAMFVGFPDEMHEEKPSFLDFENNWLRRKGEKDKKREKKEKEVRPLYEKPGPLELTESYRLTNHGEIKFQTLHILYHSILEKR